MENAKNIELVLTGYPVDDSVVLANQFTNIFLPSFRNGTTAEWVYLQPVYAKDNLFYNMVGVIGSFPVQVG